VILIKKITPGEILFDQLFISNIFEIKEIEESEKNKITETKTYNFTTKKHGVSKFVENDELEFENFKSDRIKQNIQFKKIEDGLEKNEINWGDAFEEIKKIYQIEAQTKKENLENKIEKEVSELFNVTRDFKTYGAHKDKDINPNKLNKTEIELMPTVLEGILQDLMKKTVKEKIEFEKRMSDGDERLKKTQALIHYHRASLDLKAPSNTLVASVLGDVNTLLGGKALDLSTTKNQKLFDLSVTKLAFVQRLESFENLSTKGNILFHGSYKIYKSNELVKKLTLHNFILNNEGMTFNIAYELNDLDFHLKITCLDKFLSDEFNKEIINNAENNTLSKLEYKESN
jgi:hypothetical protein